MSSPPPAPLAPIPVRSPLNRKTRPLSMYTSPSPSQPVLPAIDTDAPDQAPTPSKLKRLSLVASSATRPRNSSSASMASMSSRASTASIPEPTGSKLGTSAGGIEDALAHLTANAHARGDTASTLPVPELSHSPARPSSGASDSSTSTPTRTSHGGRDSPLRLRGHAGRTSSISYSPNTSLRGVGGGAANGAGMSGAARVRKEDSERRSGEEEPEERGTLTLTEKHGDLLRMIAMRERRVNELRQELESQEKALASLRNRWTAIARADAEAIAAAAAAAQPAATSVAPGHNTRDALVHAVRAARGSVGAAGASTSTASTSSLATVPDDEGVGGEGVLGEQEDGPGIGALFNAIATDAEETIQEGKRFWGQFMRTVGAAATGTVPEEQTVSPQDETRSSHLSGFRTMLPSLASFSLTPATDAPPPANEARLSRQSSRDTTRLSRQSSRDTTRSRTSPVPPAAALPAPVSPALTPSSPRAAKRASLDGGRPTQASLEVAGGRTLRLQRTGLGLSPNTSRSGRRPLSGPQDAEAERDEPPRQVLEGVLW